MWLAPHAKGKFTKQDPNIIILEYLGISNDFLLIFDIFYINWLKKERNINIYEEIVNMRTIHLGIGGPVGSGKTTLVKILSETLKDQYSIGVITNDIYTREDADYLIKENVLEAERIIGVETGGCPHTAIREDASMNFEAIDELKQRFDDLNIIFVESGGDNLSATFSPELVDAFIYVIDVSEGGDIPRKGGPGVTRSDFLVVNKTDLAPYVGVDLDIMKSDTKKARGERPFVFADIKTKKGLDEVIAWIKSDLLLEVVADEPAAKSN